MNETEAPDATSAKVLSRRKEPLETERVTRPEMPPTFFSSIEVLGGCPPRVTIRGAAAFEIAKEEGVDKTGRERMFELAPAVPQASRSLTRTESVEAVAETSVWRIKLVLMLTSVVSRVAKLFRDVSMT